MGVKQKKHVNHAMKILNLEHNVDTWFHDVVHYSGLVGLGATRHKTISHGLLTAFMRVGTRCRLSASLIVICPSPLIISHAFCIFRLWEDY